MRTINGKNTIVLGAGVGGIASAALLAKQGHRVTLLEAQSFPGGRCTALDKDGFRYDFGVHMFSRGIVGPHGEVNRLLDGSLSWITRDPAARLMAVQELDFPRDIRPLSRQVRLAKALGVKKRNYLGAFRLFRTLLAGRRVEENDDVSLQDYVSRYTDDDKLHLFINCVSQLYFALSHHQASAGEFIWCFSRMFNEVAYGYPVGGGGEIPRSFLKGLEKHGGRVHFQESVKSIRVQDGRVKGVETEKGEYSADVIVSNLGIRRTVELAGKKHFPAEYVNKADSYKYSNSYVTIKYALDRPIIPHPVVFVIPDLPSEKIFRYLDERTVPADPYIFMPVPSNQDPRLAPAGKQLAIAGTAAPPGATAELCDKIIDRVHARVCELFPGLENALRWQSRSASTDTGDLTGHPEGEAIGLAQTPDQVGRLRPELQTPVEGLYLVGADAGARGIGTEMASASALQLAGLLKRC